MTKRISQSLVIDASVARAAGDVKATFDTAVKCRDFLSNVYLICHKVVMSPEIRAEWSKHSSRFTRKWHKNMMARKKVVTIDITITHNLTNKINKLKLSANDKAAMLKDVPLLTAALATDKAVISLDDNARRLYRDSVKNIGVYSSINWVNPAVETEEPIQWLKLGAPLERKRRLGTISAR
jgi:hypothetical protein